MSNSSTINVRPTHVRVHRPPGGNDLRDRPAAAERASADGYSAANVATQSDAAAAALFLIATAAVDLVLLSSPAPRELLAGAALAQVSAVVIAAFRGRVHRLMRGALVVAALACIKVLSTQGAEPMFANLVLFAAIQTALLLACEALAALGRWRRGKLRLRLPRYPVVEMFGWTIIVAIAAALLRTGLGIGTESLYVGEMFLWALGPTAAYAARVVLGGSLLHAAGLGLAAISATTMLMVERYEWLIWWLNAGILAYVLAWIAVCRIQRE